MPRTTVRLTIDLNPAQKYATSYNQPLDLWNVSSVTSMASFMYGASNFDQDLCSFGRQFTLRDQPMPYLGDYYNFKDATFVGTSCPNEEEPSPYNEPIGMYTKILLCRSSSRESM